MNSRRRISALQRFVGEPIAVQVPLERLSHRADWRLRTPTGWCHKASPRPKEGPGRTSNEAPAARRGFSCLGRLLHTSAAIAVVARRGSGPSIQPVGQPIMSVFDYCECRPAEDVPKFRQSQSARRACRIGDESAHGVQ
jgi:hypothetical protein